MPSEIQVVVPADEKRTTSSSNRLMTQTETKHQQSLNNRLQRHHSVPTSTPHFNKMQEEGVPKRESLERKIHGRATCTVNALPGKNLAQIYQSQQ